MMHEQRTKTYAAIKQQLVISGVGQLNKKIVYALILERWGAYQQKMKDLPQERFRLQIPYARFFHILASHWFRQTSTSDVYMILPLFLPSDHYVELQKEILATIQCVVIWKIDSIHNVHSLQFRKPNHKVIAHLRKWQVTLPCKFNE